MGQYTIKDVQNRAELLKDDIDNIYRALNDKLGSSPETLDKVPEYILSIPDLPTEEPLTITPTIDGQEISALDDLKYNPITVEPVTSAIDSNILPENIKEGVVILGVTGTLSTGPGVFVVPAGMKFGQSTLTEFPSNLDTSNVTDMSQQFYSCRYITTIPLLDTSNVSLMPNMFSFCSKLTTIPQLDTSKVTDMNSMFNGCTSLTSIPLIDTSKVGIMERMFYDCASLTTIPQLDTSKVTTMNGMFAGCDSLVSIPLINTSNVTNMSNMFNDCSSLTTIPQLDTSKVTNISQMFAYCSKLTTVPRLDTSKVTNMYGAFTYCGNLTTVEGIDFSGLTSSLSSLFGYSNMSKLTKFIVNGKINVSMTNNDGIKALTAIDYDSVTSIIDAADRTDNTDAKTLAFNRTLDDPGGMLATRVAHCTTKGWTITGLTLNQI